MFRCSTIADSLEAQGLSWQYYAPPRGTQGYIFSVFDAINHIRNTDLWAKHVPPTTQFVSDALSGQLPAVSWIVTGPESEHPPNSTCIGENWTVSQINAIMQGPDWNSTAIFVTWDDFGGFYDHVMPANADQFGFGPRVPLLIISPYAKTGFISHTQYEFSSVLKFIEERFGLAPLTTRDAPANDMTDSFDFGQSPRLPLVLVPRNCPILSAAVVPFGTQTINTTSPAYPLVVTNNGTTPLTISNISLSGDFGQTNTCSQPLAPSATCNINTTFAPTALGSRTGTLTVTDSDPTSPQQVNLTGTGTFVNLSVAYPGLNFNRQWIGTSTPKTAILTNTGTASLNISSVSTVGDFSQTNNCGSSVAAHVSCTFTVTYSPQSSGPEVGNLIIWDSDPASPHTVRLSGIGAGVHLSATTRIFGSQLVGTNSAPQTITLTNTGKNTLTFASIVASGDYSQINTCLAGVPPGGNCTITITFVPSATGTRPGAITFNDNDLTSPQTVTTSGTGTVVQVPVHKLAFGNHLLNASTTQAVTLTNVSTTAALHFTSVTITGVNAADFTESDTCVSGSPIAPGTSCAANVTFKPSAIGSRAATVNFYDDGGASPQTVSLSGTGTAVKVASALAFGNQRVGTSTSKAIKLTNASTTNVLNIFSIAVAGTNASDFQESGNCVSSSPIPVGRTCTITVIFTPSATGSRAATLIVSDDGGGSPQKVNLTGTGT